MALHRRLLAAWHLRQAHEALWHDLAEPPLAPAEAPDEAELLHGGERDDDELRQAVAEELLSGPDPKSEAANFAFASATGAAGVKPAGRPCAKEARPVTAAGQAGQAPGHVKKRRGPPAHLLLLRQRAKDKRKEQRERQTQATQAPASQQPAFTEQPVLRAQHPPRPQLPPPGAAPRSQPFGPPHGRGAACATAAHRLQVARTRSRSPAPEHRC